MTQELLSLGKMSELVQESPRQIQRALDALDIKPSLILNDVAYYPRESAGKSLLRILDDEHPMIHGRGDE